jgi:hypothetical protein
MTTTKYTVKLDGDSFRGEDAEAAIAYEAYRNAMGNPSFMPSFKDQDEDVKLAWIFAIENCKNVDITGETLYAGYYHAVGGVALRNNRVKMSQFDEMDSLRQRSWIAAAAAINASAIQKDLYIDFGSGSFVHNASCREKKC